MIGNSLYCIEMSLDDGDRDVTIFVSCDCADTLNDLTRQLHGISFCPVAGGSAAHYKADFTLPEDRAALFNHLQSLILGI